MSILLENLYVLKSVDDTTLPHETWLKNSRALLKSIKDYFDYLFTYIMDNGKSSELFKNTKKSLFDMLNSTWDELNNWRGALFHWFNGIPQASEYKFDNKFEFVIDHKFITGLMNLRDKMKVDEKIKKHLKSAPEGLEKDVDNCIKELGDLVKIVETNFLSCLETFIMYAIIYDYERKKPSSREPTQASTDVISNIVTIDDKAVIDSLNLSFNDEVFKVVDGQKISPMEMFFKKMKDDGNFNMSSLMYQLTKITPVHKISADDVRSWLGQNPSGQDRNVDIYPAYKEFTEGQFNGLVGNLIATNTSIKETPGATFEERKESLKKIMESLKDKTNKDMVEFLLKESNVDAKGKKLVGNIIIAYSLLKMAKVDGLPRQASYLTPAVSQIIGDYMDRNPKTRESENTPERLAELISGSSESINYDVAKLSLFLFPPEEQIKCFDINGNNQVHHLVVPFINDRLSNAVEELYLKNEASFNIIPINPSFISMIDDILETADSESDPVKSEWLQIANERRKLEGSTPTGNRAYYDAIVSALSKSIESEIEMIPMINSRMAKRLMILKKIADPKVADFGLSGSSIIGIDQSVLKCRKEFKEIVNFLHNMASKLGCFKRLDDFIKISEFGKGNVHGCYYRGELVEYVSGGVLRDSTKTIFDEDLDFALLSRRMKHTTPLINVITNVKKLSDSIIILNGCERIGEHDVTKDKIELLEERLKGLEERYWPAAGVEYSGQKSDTIKQIDVYKTILGGLLPILPDSLKQFGEKFPGLNAGGKDPDRELARDNTQVTQLAAEEKSQALKELFDMIASKAVQKSTSEFEKLPVGDMVDVMRAILFVLRYGDILSKREGMEEEFELYLFMFENKVSKLEREKNREVIKWLSTINSFTPENDRERYLLLLAKTMVEEGIWIPSAGDHPTKETFIEFTEHMHVSAIESWGSRIVDRLSKYSSNWVGSNFEALLQPGVEGMLAVIGLDNRIKTYVRDVHDIIITKTPLEEIKRREKESERLGIPVEQVEPKTLDEIMDPIKVRDNKVDPVTFGVFNDAIKTLSKLIIVELSNSDYVNTVKMLHRLLDVTSFCAVEQWPTNISGLIPMVKDRITKLSLGMKEEDREKSIAEALESLKNERPKRISKQMLIELGTIKSKGMTGVLHMSQYTTARANSNQLLSILYTIDSQNYKVELMTEEIIILKYMMENMDSKYKSPIIDVLVRERLSEKRGALSEMKDFVNNYIGAMIRSDRDFKQSEKLTDRVKELVRKAFSIEINRNHLSGK